MAKSTTTTSLYTLLSSLSLLLLLLLLLVQPYAINATRPAPASTDTGKKLEKECFGEFSGNSNPRLGGITSGTGSTPTSSNVPSFTDLDHSGPAAANGHYIPGFDDTFVPNPGYEIPRSSGGASLP